MYRWHQCILFAMSFHLSEAYSVSHETEVYLKSFLKNRDYFTRSNLKYLKKGRVISNADVDTVEEGKKQVIWTKVAGLHSDKCANVLPKIARYEDYSKHMSFMDYSTYTKGVARIRLKISLLPVSFSAAVKIARMNKPGEYPFTMTAGILKNSKGKVKIEEHEGRCLIYARFDQRGPHLGYADFIMENFFTTVAKLGLENV